MPRILLKAGESGPFVEVQLERALHGEVEAYRYRSDSSGGEFEVERVGPGEGWIKLHGAVVPYHALRRGDHVEVWLQGGRHVFQLADGAARRSTRAALGEPGQFDRVTAPMPGVIRRIAVQLGDRVEPHQPLVIMESMKMELTLSVPNAGRVVEIACDEGELVEMGAVLVRLEEAT